MMILLGMMILLTWWVSPVLVVAAYAGSTLGIVAGACWSVYCAYILWELLIEWDFLREDTF